MLVTVLMAVYNCEAYVGQAMESVLAQQVAYLESKPEVGLVGCASRWIDGQEHFLRTMQPVTAPEQVGPLFLRAVPFLHGTLMIRRECLRYWSLQFLLIALLLDPRALASRRYLFRIGQRKVRALGVSFPQSVRSNRFSG